LGGTATDKLRAAGGAVAETAKIAATRADVLITMLPSGKEVREVYLGAGGVIENANAGTLLIDSSTIDVESARVVAAAAEQRGLLMIDAPVSGGVGGAQAGSLTFMVGGPEQAFARAKSILEVMGKTIVHAGGAGNGQAAKICNNMILGVSMIAVSEAFVLAEKIGLDKQKLFDIAESVRSMLVNDELLSRSGTGADIARQPRLSARVYDSDDAEGSQTRAGSSARGKCGDADGRRGSRALRAACGAGQGCGRLLRHHSLSARGVSAPRGTNCDCRGSRPNGHPSVNGNARIHFDIKSLARQVNRIFRLCFKSILDRAAYCPALKTENRAPSRIKNKWKRASHEDRFEAG